MEYNIPVNSNLFKKVLSKVYSINSENINQLALRTEAVFKNNNEIIDISLEKDVINYIRWLKKAENNWPEFIFSYDPECQKVATYSHYRYDNLVNRDKVTSIIESSLAYSKKEVLNELSKLGDIYIDLYQAVSAEERIVQPYLDSKSISHKEIAYLVEEKLAVESWDSITKLLREEMIPLDYIYFNNYYLMELAIENNTPQNILFEWHHIGVPIYNSSLNRLISIEKYSDFTYFLIKNGKLTNKRRKTLLFQVARNNNVKLLELLLNDYNSGVVIKYDNGLSPLSWTLLNYSNSLKDQLELIISKFSTLSNSDKLLMSKIN